MGNVLIVDPDKNFSEGLAAALREAGHEASWAPDGWKAVSLVDAEHPDLVILEVILSGMNGYETCKELRRLDPSIPVVFLSSKGDIVDKTLGFRSGGDDYVTKPIQIEELLLRVESLLRRVTLLGEDNGNGRIHVGELEILPRNYEVRVAGEGVHLSAREFELLSFLASHLGQVFSRRQLCERIWGLDHVVDDSFITVYVRRIREKIEKEPHNPKHLLTVWGVGYKLA